MPAEELLGIERGEIGQVQVRKVTVPNVVGVLWSKWPPGKVGAQSRSIWIAGGNAHANEMIRMYEDRSTFFFGPRLMPRRPIERSFMVASPSESLRSPRRQASLTQHQSIQKRRTLEFMTQPRVSAAVPLCAINIEMKFDLLAWSRVRNSCLGPQ